VVDLQQGFVLTRHWRDTPAGTEVEFWLATDAGPRRVRLAHQPSVAFIPAAQREAADQRCSQVACAAKGVLGGFGEKFFTNTVPSGRQIS